MLKNVAFIFADIRQSAPMLWWGGKYILVSPQIREKTAPSFGKVWLNQYMVVTQNRCRHIFSDEGILDRSLNFAKIHTVLHVKNYLVGGDGITRFGVRFDDETPFVVEISPNGNVSYTDNSEAHLNFSQQKKDFLKVAFDVILKR